jgi:hypothetical protein
MKTYTLTIIYNDKTDELESLEERIAEKEAPLSIDANPDTMEKIFQADLIEDLLVPHPGERVGEA